MELDFKLTNEQINQIASYISIQDIQEFINNNQEEYKQFLEEELKEQRKNNKKYKFFYGSFLLATNIKVGVMQYEYFCTN